MAWIDGGNSTGGDHRNSASVRENVSKLGNLTIRESMAKKMKITEISMLRDFSS